MLPSPLYYESHITIEPVFEQRLEDFKEICKKHKFRVAEFLLKKRVYDTAERSSLDSFCTGRSNNFEELKSTTYSLVSELASKGFQVWRYKIESALIDVRLK